MLEQSRVNGPFLFPFLASDSSIKHTVLKKTIIQLYSCLINSPYCNACIFRLFLQFTLIMQKNSPKKCYGDQDRCSYYGSGSVSHTVMVIRTPQSFNEIGYNATTTPVLTLPYRTLAQTENKRVLASFFMKTVQMVSFSFYLQNNAHFVKRISSRVFSHDTINSN